MFCLFFELFFVIDPETLLNFQGSIVKRVYTFTCHASLPVAPFLYHKDEKDGKDEISGLHQNKDPKSLKIMVN